MVESNAGSILAFNLVIRQKYVLKNRNIEVRKPSQNTAVCVEGELSKSPHCILILCYISAAFSWLG